MSHYPADIKTWPKGVVPYEIAHGYSWNPTSLKSLTAAIAEVNSVFSSRINMREKKKTDKNWISFEWNMNDSTRCSSSVGKQGGKQVIQCSLKSLIGGDGEPSFTKKSTFLHEIGHALGLNHEHQRFDRNAYIIVEEVIAYKLAGRHKADFQKLSAVKNIMFGVYDCKSRMHYREKSFEGARYLYAKPGGVCDIRTGIGRESGYSPGDIACIKSLYN